MANKNIFTAQIAPWRRRVVQRRTGQRKRGSSMGLSVSGSLAKTASALWDQGKYIAASHAWRRAMQALINEMGAKL